MLPVKESISGNPSVDVPTLELNEIQATLSPEGRQAGDVVQVRLHAMATESGTLELLAVANDGQRWKVEFDVRSGATESAAA